MEVNLFHRKFVSEVRRCDEMERKLRYIEAEVLKDRVAIPESNVNPLAPNPREIIDLEVRDYLYQESLLWNKAVLHCYVEVEVLYSKQRESGRLGVNPLAPQHLITNYKLHQSFGDFWFMIYHKSYNAIS